MYYVGMVPFLLQIVPGQRFVNLADLSIQVFCQMAMQSLVALGIHCYGVAVV